MTYDEERIVTRSDQTQVATTPPADPGPPGSAPADPGQPASVPAHGAAYGSTVTQERIVRRGSTAQLWERVVVFVFGVVQLLLVLRVVLLLLNAREGNDLVSLIYNISDPLVAPFRGILGKGGIADGGTYLDGAALVALVGWTIAEFVIIGLIRVFRRAA